MEQPAVYTAHNTKFASGHEGPAAPLKDGYASAWVTALRHWKKLCLLVALSLEAGEGPQYAKVRSAYFSSRLPLTLPFVQIHEEGDGHRDISADAREAHEIIIAAEFDLMKMSYKSLNTVFLFLCESTMAGLVTPFTLVTPKAMKAIFTSWSLYWTWSTETEVDPAKRIGGADGKPMPFNNRYPEVLKKLKVVVQSLSGLDKESAIAVGIPPLPGIVAACIEAYLRSVDTTHSRVQTAFHYIMKYSGCRGGCEVNAYNSQMLIGPKGEKVLGWPVQRINYYKVRKNAQIGGDLSISKCEDICMIEPDGIQACVGLTDPTINPAHMTSLLNQAVSPADGRAVAKAPHYHKLPLPIAKASSMTCDLIEAASVALETQTITEYSKDQVFPAGVNALLKNGKTELGGRKKTKLANTSYRKALVDLMTNADVRATCSLTDSCIHSFLTLSLSVALRRCPTPTSAFGRGVK
jgi:hypothetical protein